MESGGPDRIRGEVNAVYVAEPEIRRVLHALLNSSLFYYFFSAFSDGRHVNPSDVSNFPADPTEYAPKTKSALSSLSFRLEASMTANTVQRRKSGLLVDSVNSRQTKPDIDEIDRVLATHYGLTDEELDFIINYDIKYRMGTDAGEDD